MQRTSRAAYVPHKTTKGREHLNSNQCVVWREPRPDEKETCYLELFVLTCFFQANPLAAIAHVTRPALLISTSFLLMLVARAGDADARAACAHQTSVIDCCAHIRSSTTCPPRRLPRRCTWALASVAGFSVRRPMDKSLSVWRVARSDFKGASICCGRRARRL